MANRFAAPSAEELHSKRQQILEAAYVVFSRKGYYQTTIDEIIALADTGKGTVYNHFVNKEQLFYTVVKEKSAPFHMALEMLVNSLEQPSQKISKVIRLFLEFYVAHANLWRVLMHEMRSLGCLEFQNQSNSPQNEKFRESFYYSLDQLEKILQEALVKGFLRECDTKKAAYGLFSVIVTTVFQKFVSNDEVSLDETADMISDIFLHGVAVKEPSQLS